MQYGLGLHLSDLQQVDPGWIAKALIYRWAFSALAVIALGLGKLAIMGYLVIIEGKSLNTKRSRKWFLYFLAATNVSICIAMMPIIYTQCTPFNKLWDSRIVGQCTGGRRYQIFAYAWSSKKILTSNCLIDGYLLTTFQATKLLWMSFSHSTPSPSFGT